MASLIYSVLHDDTTTISDGKIINIKEAKELGLSISGTSTSFTVEFYSIDIAALVYFKAKISAIANGNVSVTAHAII